MKNLEVKALVMPVSSEFGYNIFLKTIQKIEEKDDVQYPSLLWVESIIGEGYNAEECRMFQKELDRIKEKWYNELSDDDKYVWENLKKAVDRAVEFNVGMRWT